MNEFLPVIIVGAVIGMLSLAFLIAYGILRSKEIAQKSERTMTDRQLIIRLLSYAKPYWKDFIIVFAVMLISVVYDVVSPLLLAKWWT